MVYSWHDKTMYKSKCLDPLLCMMTLLLENGVRMVFRHFNMQTLRVVMFFNSSNCHYITQIHLDYTSECSSIATESTNMLAKSGLYINPLHTFGIN